MLRSIFVIAIILFGAAASLRGPFHALLFYLWIAYFRPEQWVWTDALYGLNLSFWTGIYLVIATLISRERARFDLRSALILLFTLQGLMSALASDHSEYALGMWVYFAKGATVTYLIAMLTTDRDRFRLVFLVIALSLGFEVTKQGWVELLQNPGAKNDNELPFLGDNNGVAVGVLMLIPVLLALAETSRTKGPRFLFRFMALGGFFRALTTYSRGGFVAAGFVAAIQFVRSRHKLRVIAVVLLAAALLFPVMPQEFWDRMSTIKTAGEEDPGDDSIAGRFHFWRVGAAMAQAHPFLGVGYHAFIPAYDDHDFSYGKYGVKRAVHSTWFGVLGELGIPGFIVFVTLIALSLRACGRVRRLAAGNPHLTDIHEYAVALETSLCAFVVGGTFLTLQYNEMMWHFVGLTMALETVAARAATELPALEVAPAPAASTAPLRLAPGNP